VLNDPAKANPKAIEELSMVKGCFTNAGQFQVVIGTEVGDYYQALLATTGHSSADKEQAKKAASKYEMARAADLALCGDLLPAAASADQRGLDLRLP
jgi:glucose-like phosphotransferase system IIB component